MTIQQLRTAIETARTDFITRAAKNCIFPSQTPAACSGCWSMPLVYEIFSRTNSGIFRTEAGLRFLEHTKIILVQMQELYAVRGQGRIYRLRLGVQSYSPAVEAAIRLTQEYQGRRSSNASTFLAAASARFPIWGWMHLRR